MKKYKNILSGFIFILILVLATLFTWIYSQIDSALPILDGKKTVFGLTNTVIVERDDHGIVTISADNRTDIALATGFIHAQERFFQMDLLRKNSAGELASLFGELALEYDKSIRRHRFRDRARIIIQQLPQEQYQLLKAYTRGVNQGLSYLQASPFEYLLLRQAPVEWQEEDTVLAVFSMYIDLQYSDGKRERTLATIKDALGDEVFSFLNPKGSQWDAAIDGSEFSPSPMPTQAWPAASALLDKQHSLIAQTLSYQDGQFPGSNNWAISGEISQTGSAMVANDMHLNIRVPNTWFRASFNYKHDDDTITVTGLTLPGTPTMVIGSNTHIAWGFTNSYGDWSDIIELELNDKNDHYLTPTGYLPFTYIKQVIAVKGQESVEIQVKETIWGPVIGENNKGKSLVYRWVAHDINAVNMNQIKLEYAKNVDQAFIIAAQAGIPAQNLMVADKEGNIGWTIMGPIPQKKGKVGELPTSWSNGDNGWLGYLSASQYPTIKNPKQNRLWTANSRVVGGEMFEKLGNGGYALGARSRQIRDDLLNKTSFNEQDLLNIALDDKAVFLQRWQTFIQNQLLTNTAISQHQDWSEIKILLADKQLYASIDSVAYRLVKNFRLNVRDAVFQELNSSLSQYDQGYNFSSIRHQIETPLWQLINEQPDNFLWRAEDSWQELFNHALDKTIKDMSAGQLMSAATWGQENTATIVHPLSKAVPFIGHWLDMPATQLPGDSYMPRVQGKAFGASERMVVSPGHEETGILQMPTSQSGHPWSPYYGKGHEDWENGVSSPFLPGKTQYTLTLLSY